MLNQDNVGVKHEWYLREDDKIIIDEEIGLKYVLFVLCCPCDVHLHQSVSKTVMARKSTAVGDCAEAVPSSYLG